MPGPMDSGAIKVHHLHELDVVRGRTTPEALPDFLRFIGNRPLVGCWIGFYARMLNKYLLGKHSPSGPADQYLAAFPVG
jgi:DNA polymerase-3 subunit epsilon